MTAQSKSFDQVFDLFSVVLALSVIMRRMIRHESIVIAPIVAALGPPLGVLLAALTTRALEGLGIGFHLPEQELAYFVVLAVVVGIGAVVLPPRRAARLNGLQTLQYE